MEHNLDVKSANRANSHIQAMSPSPLRPFEVEGPLVAVLSSTRVDEDLSKRGFTSVAHLLTPFSTHSLNIKDPNGHLNMAKVAVDFRDIRKQGHFPLVTLSHVLAEALSCGRNLDESMANFTECLQRFVEPNDYETLRAYIGCVFVISSGEENPLGELNRLIQLQHAQQHGTEDYEDISPAHFTPIRWLSSTIVKHFILLHDQARDDDDRTAECFSQMCSIYGPTSCQLLRIGQGYSLDVPDVWSRLEFLEEIGERGIAKALSREPSAPATAASARETLSVLDREECSKTVGTLLRKSLVPFAERVMRILNDQLAERRRLSQYMMNGLTGVKKWLGAGIQPRTYVPVTFASDCTELKYRRLADLAFQFGLYAYAHLQYTTTRREFENCQAWVHSAAASEMSAVALRLAHSELTAKQFPVRYLEDAVKHMTRGAAKYSCVMRCAINSGRIMTELEQPRDAAMLMSQVSSLDSDHCVGVAQVHAARYFQEAGMERKSAFYYVLAGNRFMKGGVQSVALECYRLALGHYYAKQWNSIKDHLSSVLSQQSSDQRLTIEHRLNASRNCSG